MNLVNHMPNTDANKRSLVQAGRNVKAKLITAGLKMASLAAEAGVTSSTLSWYVSGRSRGYDKQVSIWAAYCTMTGEQCTLAEFWGELLNRRIAG